MRSRHVTVMANDAAPRRRSRYAEIATLLALVGFAGLIGYAFAQEAYVGHRLAQEEANLSQQNVQIAAQNAQYEKDIAAVRSGADAEESARKDGYARPNEKVYVIPQSPPDTAPHKPVVKVDEGQGDLWSGFTRWLTQRLHR